jgi:hypothetical protein
MTEASLDQFQCSPGCRQRHCALGRSSAHRTPGQRAYADAYLRDITQFTGFLKGHLGVCA